MKKRLSLLFNKKWYLFSFNLTLCLGSVLLNNHLQAFCQPVSWVTAVLLICFLPLLFFPYLKDRFFKKIMPLIFFIFGIAFSICMYCILFLEHMNVLGLPVIFLIIGLFVFTPHILAIQILYFVRRSDDKTNRNSFYAGLLFSVTLTLVIGLKYSQTINRIQATPIVNLELLQGTYMEEKILGAHFKYHTRICEYDGWRPPLHDPILVVGRWLNLNRDLDWTLEERIERYARVFPELPLRQDCSCAYEYSEVYFLDERLNPKKQ